MREAITSIEEHKVWDERGNNIVWDLVPRSRDKKIIKSEWIYNIKEDPNTE